MKTKLLMVSMAIAATIMACNNGKKETKARVITKDSLIKRGAYLVQIIGCGDCHSPKQMGAHGPEPITGLELSGYRQNAAPGKISEDAFKKGWVLMNGDLTAAAGPWGISFAANITSDATGIGNWTEEQFKRAMKEGKYKGIATARNLLPPMPWPNFSNMSDEDIKAIYTFLQSTKPVRNVVPAPISLEEAVK